MSPLRQTYAPPSLGHVLEFMQLVWALSHGLQATSKRMERTLGVSGSQRLVIRIIGQMPGISAGTLAAVLRVHPSTLTGVLRRLEERGFVHRAPSKTDRRRAVLHLTRSGKRLNARIEGTVEAAVSRVLDDLPGLTVGEGRRLLAALAGELGAASRARLEAGRGAG